VGGSHKTRREPLEPRGEHANSTQDCPPGIGDKTWAPLAVRGQ